MVPGTPSQTQGQIVVETEASSDYRSIVFGPSESVDKVFTGLYKAWFIRVEFQPAPGWLCGQHAATVSKIVVSREDGTGLAAVTDLSFSDGAGGSMGLSASYVCWSPDGQRIAVAPGGAYIAVCNRDGTNLHRVTPGLGFGALNGMSWGANGAIYFSRELAGQTDLWFIYPDADDPFVVKLTDDSAGDICPDVSPDGKWLAWARRASPSDDWDIVTMPVNGDPLTDIEKVTFSPDDERQPRWSPDGHFIAYIRKMEQVWVVDTVTQLSRQLTNPAAGSADGPCDWSCDGRYVLFNRDKDLYRISYVGKPGQEKLVRSNWGTEVASQAVALRRYRVVVGPNNADWGGRNPSFGAKRAGVILVYTAERLVNAVSFVVASSDKIMMANRTPSGPQGVVVCEVRSGNLRRVLEDNGPGLVKTVWVLEQNNVAPGAALIVFNARTGKVGSVIALKDQVGSAAASGPVVEMDDGKLVVRGAAMTVYDGRGRQVSAAASVSTAAFDAETGQPMM